jgi:hypothetical protein
MPLKSFELLRSFLQSSLFNILARKQDARCFADISSSKSILCKLQCRSRLQQHHHHKHTTSARCILPPSLPLRAPAAPPQAAAPLPKSRPCHLQVDLTRLPRRPYDCVGRTIPLRPAVYSREGQGAVGQRSGGQKMWWTMKGWGGRAAKVSFPAQIFMTAYAIGCAKGCEYVLLIVDLACSSVLYLPPAPRRRREQLGRRFFLLEFRRLVFR